MVEPQYPMRQAAVSVLDPYKDQLVTWLKADSHRNKRERRGINALFEALRAMGYAGSSTPVYRFAQRWKVEQSNAPKNVGFVPLHLNALHLADMDEVDALDHQIGNACV
jgi:uncharacterized protein YukJ